MRNRDVIGSSPISPIMKYDLFYIIFDVQHVIYEPFYDKKRNVRIGMGTIIRPYSFIYDDVLIGGNVTLGHNVLIREKNVIGENSKIGTNAVIEGRCIIGENVCMQSNVFIPTHTYIGDNVFIGPNVSMTNDKYPPTSDYKKLKGATICDNVIICANVIILPGVTIGKNAFLAAGSLITKNVPENKMAIGSPAKIVEKPKQYMQMK